MTNEIAPKIDYFIGMSVEGVRKGKKDEDGYVIDLPNGQFIEVHEDLTDASEASGFPDAVGVSVVPPVEDFTLVEVTETETHTRMKFNKKDEDEIVVEVPKETKVILKHQNFQGEYETQGDLRDLSIPDYPADREKHGPEDDSEGQEGEG